MPTITEKIELTRRERKKADEAFRAALKRGRALGMSWSALATASGMSITGVRWLVLDLKDRHKEPQAEGRENGG